MSMKPIPYGKQEITGEDLEAVAKVLKSEFLTQGPQVSEFENNFRDYVGSKYAIAVSNGTAALHLCALALGVNDRQTVITTPITFAASSNCVLYCGGKVEFVDIDSRTGLIDLVKVEELLRSKPKGFYSGIIPVDFAGNPVNLQSVKKLADEFGLWIIEDACHAPGGYFIDNTGIQQRCGNGVYADLAIFSFHPVKHIATGEGGMITTNSKELYEKILKLRTHGITRNSAEFVNTMEGGWYHEMQELGYNYRICDILCALGVSQLKKASERLTRRIAIASRYDKAFAGNSNISTLSVQGEGDCHAYHLYVIKVKDRLGLYNFLRANNVFAQVHYIPVYKMPYYQANGFKDVKHAQAENYYSTCLSLPMYPGLTSEEQDFVIKLIFEFLN